MTSFDWSVLSASLAGGLGVGFLAITALRRHKTRRHPEPVPVGSGSRRRRIEVVAINDANPIPNGSRIERQCKR
jgi:hypothetical protein